MFELIFDTLNVTPILSKQFSWPIQAMASLWMLVRSQREKPATLMRSETRLSLGFTIEDGEFQIWRLQHAGARGRGLPAERLGDVELAAVGVDHGK